MQELKDKGILDEALTSRERFVLVKRFGLDGNPPYTLQAIGTRMGVSRERVRQIAVKALDKLNADPWK
jgi:RNA polymerase primary sigma factor